MALASILFALMNVTVRLGSAHVPWAEVAGVRDRWWGRWSR